jgi:hypothetical protein
VLILVIFSLLEPHTQVLCRHAFSFDNVRVFDAPELKELIILIGFIKECVSLSIDPLDPRFFTNSLSLFPRHN